jgi:hypothetical protein
LAKKRQVAIERANTRNARLRRAAQAMDETGLDLWSAWEFLRKDISLVEKEP